VKQTYSTLTLDIEDRIATVTFRREKDTNAFSRAMTLELTEVCRSLAEDERSPEPRIGAVIVTGGTGRSFSVGGDFNDVSALSTEEQIRSYLGEILDSYIAVLRIGVPVVAAIDRFAIGQGLQVALMTDFRIGASRCKLQMPELKNGVACPLGSVILEFLIGRAKMLELILDCEFLEAETSRGHYLLNQVTAPEELQSTAAIVARKLAAYPRTPFVGTKRIQNDRFIAALEAVREPSSQVHIASFLEKTATSHFERILKTSQRG
jgi:carboxymethylproline synthase